MLTKLESASIDLMIELEYAIAKGANIPAAVVVALNRVKIASQTPNAEKLQQVYRFAKIATEENLMSSIDTSGRPMLTLIKPGN